MGRAASCANPEPRRKTAVANKKKWDGDAALLDGVLKALPLNDSGNAEVEYSTDAESRPHKKRPFALTSVQERLCRTSPRTTVKQSTMEDSLHRLRNKTYESYTMCDFSADVDPQILGEVADSSDDEPGESDELKICATTQINETPVEDSQIDASEDGAQWRMTRVCRIMSCLWTGLSVPKPEEPAETAPPMKLAGQFRATWPPSTTS